MSPKTWERNENGDIVDPPVIRAHEQRINDASAAADTDLLAYEYAAYADERTRVVNAIEAAGDTDRAEVTPARASGISTMLAGHGVPDLPATPDNPAEDTGGEPGELRGEALHARAAELEIEGRGTMSADELRAAVRDAEGTS